MLLACEVHLDYGQEKLRLLVRTSATCEEHRDSRGDKSSSDNSSQASATFLEDSAAQTRAAREGQISDSALIRAELMRQTSDN